MHPHRRDAPRRERVYARFQLPTSSNRLASLSLSFSSCSSHGWAGSRVGTGSEEGRGGAEKSQPGVNSAAGRDARSKQHGHATTNLVVVLVFVAFDVADDEDHDEDDVDA